MNQITINVPEGHEIDLEKSSLETRQIFYKPIEKVRPMKWEDLKRVKGYYLDNNGQSIPYDSTPLHTNKNTFPTKELAEASLALSQLLQLRQAWIGDWIPDWTDESDKHIVFFLNGKIRKNNCLSIQHVLSFPDHQMTDDFINTFGDLIETAKPLL